MDSPKPSDISYPTIGSPPPWKPRELAAAFVLGFFVTPMVTVAILGMHFPDLTEKGKLFSHLASYTAWLFLFGYFRLRYGREILGHLGLVRRLSWLDSIVVGFFCGCLLLGASWVIAQVVDITGSEYSDPYKFFPREHIQVISLLAVLIAPVMEEIIFRGFVQTTLYQYTHPASNILLTALLFSSLHSYYYGDWFALTYVTILGIILGMVRHFTQSIIPCIIGHTLINVMAVVSLINIAE